MKNWLWIWLTCFSLIGDAQDNSHQINVTNSGIHFEDGLSWAEIKEKAKVENKFIFVDCFTTWCAPCKKMEREVYSDDKVGDALNKDFLSVRLQIDSSKVDNSSVRAWYRDAREIAQAYKINAYPSYLFFAPDGRLVHRGLGYQKKTDFINLINDASNPRKQYFTLLQNYEHGEIDYSILPYLARKAREFNEHELSLRIASNYLHDYLDKLSQTQYTTRANLDFVRSFAEILNSSDRIFQWYVGFGKTIDSVAGDDSYARSFVNYVIYKEEVKTKIKEAEKQGVSPNWRTISKSIKRKYGPTFVRRNILEAKVAWYKSKKDWKQYAKYLTLKVDMNDGQDLPDGFVGIMILNNAAWEIFQYSNKKAELKKAILWSNRALELKEVSGVLDTKANLLYKLGKQEMAIKLENRALQLTPSDASIIESLQKMKNGEPTWALQN